MKQAMHERKRGKLRTSRSRKRVTSRRQAVAIGFSMVRRSGAKVPRRSARHRTQSLYRSLYRSL